MNDQEIFTHPDHPGLRFRVHIEQDADGDAPWEREDGHGHVRDRYHGSERPNKQPGERILHDDRGTYWFYDWQGACALARKDGWNTQPYDAPNRIERAVQADFDRLRRWLRNDWCYVGVCVEALGRDKDAPPATSKYAHALWGVESDCDEYITEVAMELADEAGKECAKLGACAMNIVNRSFDAERWNKLRNVVKTKDLGTEFDEYGKPHSPTFRRWYFDTAPDILTLDAALDSIKVI
jgi:hypothetical protein